MKILAAINSNLKDEIADLENRLHPTTTVPPTTAPTSAPPTEAPTTAPTEPPTTVNPGRKSEVNRKRRNA
jgi:hypothetical protein